MNIKMNIQEGAFPPYKKNVSNYGWELFSTKVEILRSAGVAVYYTGISVEIPKGYVGLLLPLPKIPMQVENMHNTIGIINPGDNEEIVFRYTCNHGDNLYKKDERVGQIIVVPAIEVEWTLNLIKK